MPSFPTVLSPTTPRRPHGLLPPAIPAKDALSPPSIRRHRLPPVCSEQPTSLLLHPLNPFCLTAQPPRDTLAERETHRRWAAAALRGSRLSIGRGRCRMADFGENDEERSQGPANLPALVVVVPRFSSDACRLRGALLLFFLCSGMRVNGKAIIEPDGNGQLVFGVFAENTIRPFARPRSSAPSRRVHEPRTARTTSRRSALHQRTHGVSTGIIRHKHCK